MTTALTASEQSRLATIEHRIHDLIESHKAIKIEFGQLFREIRDGKLYRATHNTFGSYMADRWDVSRGHAYRLIEAAEVVQNVSIGDKIQAPVRESQTREIAKAPPEKQAEVWETARRGRDPDKVTARELAEARQAQDIPAPQTIKATTEEAQELYQCRVMLEWVSKFSGDDKEILLSSITRYINTNYSYLSSQPNGHPLWRPLIRKFLDAFEERFGSRPNLTASDFRQMKGLLKRFADMNLEWWEKGFARFMTDTEEWVRDHGQPMRCFADHFNRWNPDKKTRMEQYREDIENAANRIH